MAAEPRSGLRRKATRGVAWSAANALIARLISTVVFIILARLLDPATIGLVGLALVFITFCRLVVDQGLGAAIVQRSNVDKAHLDTSFWTSVATGVFMAILLGASAGPISRALDSEDLAPVLQALCLILIIGAPSSTASAVLRRDLQFKSLAYRKLLAAVTGGMVGVAAAIAGLGVWALVAQALAQTLVSTVTLWIVVPYRPGFTGSRSNFRDLFGFSNKVIGIGLVDFFSKRADDLLVGAVLGPAALGLYSVAYRILTVMTDVLTVAIDNVAFATLSRLQHDIPRLRQAYLVALRSSFAVAAPAFALAAVLAPDVIHVLFGERWEASTEVMQALSLAGIAQAIAASNNSLLLAIGRARTALQLNAGFALANVIGFAIAVQFGILAVALAFTLRAYLLLPWSIQSARKALDLSLGAWIRPLWPAALSAVLMSASGVALSWTVLPEESLVRLAVIGPSAMLLYLLLLRVLARDQFRELCGFLRLLAPRMTRRANR